MTRWLAVGWHSLFSPYAALVCRLVLGVIFVTAGLSKIDHQSDVIQTVTGFGILPDFLVRPFAVMLPWVELLSGSLLIVGLLLPSASALLLLVNLAFVIAVGVNLLRGNTIDCGCFGKGEPLNWEVFFRDVGLLLLSVQIVAARGRFLTLDGMISWLWRLRTQSQGSIQNSQTFH